MLKALQKGLITEAEIDKALTYALTARFRLGLFDPADKVPFARIPHFGKRHAGTRSAGAQSRAPIHRAAQK
ncbi:MAG: hypothetical protein WDM76_04445 [Limisphaerales bacterium]